MTFLTPEQLADMLATTERHVLDLARAERIPHTRIGRKIRFEQTAIEEWIKRNSVLVD